MKGIHNVFHVFMVRKYLWDPEHKIDLEPIHVEQDLIVECRSVHILEMLECVLRRMIIKYVRALWTNQSEREPTLEHEE